MVLLSGSVFLIEPGWILGLWLGDVPPYATAFLVLFIIDNIVQSLNAGISNLIWASGKISLYQILVSSINILSVVAGYFVLRGGAPAYYLLVAYVFFSVFRFFAIQWALHRTLNYENKKLWKNSYIPSLLVVVLYIPIFLIPDTLHPFVRILLSFLYLCCLEWKIGLTKKEQNQLVLFFKNKLHR